MLGISSAPELYQHTVEQVLAKCEGAYNIHDDIIIYVRSVEEPDNRLQKTIECIRDKGPTLNPEKCVFRMPQLPFMGYLLSTLTLWLFNTLDGFQNTLNDKNNSKNSRWFLLISEFIKEPDVAAIRSSWWRH